MATSKQPNYVVKHKRLYFTAALPGQDRSKFQHVPEGTQLTLTDKQAKGFGSRVGPIGGKVATLDDTDGGDKLAALKSRAAELNIKDAHKFGEKRLNEEIKKAEEAIAAGNAVTG